MHMHHDSLLPSHCVCTTLRKAGRAVSRLYDEALEGAGLTTPQFAILRTIHRGGTVPLSRLAEALVMERTSLYRALGPLEREGWVAIEEASAGRAKLVSLTDTGRALIDDASTAWEAVQTGLVERLGAENWAALEGLLRDVTIKAGETAK